MAWLPADKGAWLSQLERERSLRRQLGRERGLVSLDGFRWFLVAFRCFFLFTDRFLSFASKGFFLWLSGIFQFCYFTFQMFLFCFPLLFFCFPALPICFSIAFRLLSDAFAFQCLSSALQSFAVASRHCPVAAAGAFAVVRTYVVGALEACSQSQPCSVRISSRRRCIHSRTYVYVRT